MGRLENKVCIVTGASAGIGRATAERFSREGELSAMMRLLDAVAQARQMRANQVTWQAVVERLLLSLMEEKSKWST